MSGPTKIYLVLVAILVVAWGGVSAFLAAGEPGLHFITDPDYPLDHSERFSAVLRGRVDVRDAEGNPIAPPEDTLEVDVESRDASEVLAVRRINYVQPDGVFEVTGLLHGLAKVSVRLGGGEIIWQRDDIVVGGAGILDPRIDPIDLGDDLFAFDLEVRGPSGTTTNGGHLVWRQIGTSNGKDAATFDGLAPIGSDGHARFLSTSATVDAVCLVPGARTELFEELYLDSSIDLGPGITIELGAEGTLPDPSRWTVHAMLVPIELHPKVELVRRSSDFPEVRPFVEMDARTGMVLIPVARGGRYRLTWTVLQKRRHPFNRTKLPDSVDLVVPSEPGLFRVKREFPIDAFLRKVPGG